MTDYARLAAAFPYDTLPKVPVVQCPACQTPRNGQVPTPAIDRCGFTIALCRCATCSMRYLHEQLTRDGYDRLYAGAYRRLVAALRDETYDPCGALEPPAEQCRRLGDYRTIVGPRLRDHAPSTLLDAGGASGDIGQRLAACCDPRPAVTVLEPAPDVPVAGVTMVHGYLEDAFPGRFDSAICLETMDHVTNPLVALRHLREAVPTGVLFVDIIDADLQKRRRGSYLLKIDHPLYWTQRAFDGALRQSGWTPQRTMLLPERLLHFGKGHLGSFTRPPYRVLMECT